MQMVSYSQFNILVPGEIKMNLFVALLWCEQTPVYSNPFFVKCNDYQIFLINDSTASK